MNQLDRRITELEQRSAPDDPAFIVIVGEPTPADEERMARATVAVILPDNQRGDHGRDTRQAG